MFIVINNAIQEFSLLSHHGILAIIPCSINMVSVRVFFFGGGGGGRICFCFLLLFHILGRFDNTIIMILIITR